jgi:hypothetical protein
MRIIRLSNEESPERKRRGEEQERGKQDKQAVSWCKRRIEKIDGCNQMRCKLPTHVLLTRWGVEDNANER